MLTFNELGLAGSRRRWWNAQCDARDTPTPEPALSRPPARASARREAERRDMSSSVKHADARDVRLWVDEESAPADATGRTRGIGRANGPDANARTFPSLIPARAGAVTESAAHDAGGVSDSGGSDSDDDDDKRTCGEAVATAGSSVFDFVARRFDLLVGVAGLISALWLWLLLDTKQRTDGDDHPWRWALFVACVFLGRWVARSLVSFVIFVLDRYDSYAEHAYGEKFGSDSPRESVSERGSGSQTNANGKPEPERNASGNGNVHNARRPMSALLYYVNVLRSDIKTALLAVGVAVAWTTLMRPSRGNVGANAHTNISRALACVIVVMVFRAIRNYLVHWLASRLHSSTLWEQLHATVRQENILKRLAGPPIRPRPRSRAKARARWTLVKKRVDENNAGGGAKGARGLSQNREGQRRTSPEKGKTTKSTAEAEPARSRAEPAVLSDGVEKKQPPPREGSFAKPPASSVSDAVLSTSAPEKASAWLPSVIESLEEASALDGAATAAEGESPADVVLSKAEERHAALAEAPPDAPISASAAAAAVGASEEPLSPSRVPLRVIDAAARHVLRGSFALPFRVLTSGGRGATRRSGSGGHGTKTSGAATGALISSHLQHRAIPGELKATTKRAFVSSPEDADAAATLMFQHLRRSGQPFVTPEAVGDFIEPDKVEEAFQLIGGADSGVAALAESNIAAAMRGIYEQREACSKTLANTAGLVRNVGRLLTVLLGIVALFISLGIFEVDVANLWLVFSSALLAFAFVFGQTAATMFRALIMIFVTNPFGVGDWVRFGDDPVTVKIQELGLNFVVVETFWGEVIFLPVSACLDARIYNLSRSPSLWMNATIDLDVGTVNASDVERLRESLAAHVDSDGANYAKGSVEVVCREVRDPLKVRISIFYQLAFKASEFSRKLAANSRFLLALQAALMEIGLSYCGTDGQIFTCEETSRTRFRREQRRNEWRRDGAGGSARATPSAPSPAHSRRVSKGDVARDIAASFKQAQREREALEARAHEAARAAASRERTPEPLAGESGSFENVAGVVLSSVPGGERPFERESAEKVSAEERKEEPSPVASRAGFDTREGTFVPGLGFVIPETNPGLRYRGSHRIPGRVRHYTGNLRDMSEVIRFDARDGQFDEQHHEN